jgi:hypothetical protein
MSGTSSRRTGSRWPRPASRRCPRTRHHPVEGERGGEDHHHLDETAVPAQHADRQAEPADADPPDHHHGQGPGRFEGLVTSSESTDVKVRFSRRSTGPLEQRHHHAIQDHAQQDQYQQPQPLPGLQEENAAAHPGRHLLAEPLGDRERALDLGDALHHLAGLHGLVQLVQPFHRVAVESPQTVFTRRQDHAPTPRYEQGPGCGIGLLAQGVELDVGGSVQDLLQVQRQLPATNPAQGCRQSAQVEAGGGTVQVRLAVALEGLEEGPHRGPRARELGRNAEILSCFLRRALLSPHGGDGDCSKSQNQDETAHRQHLLSHVGGCYRIRGFTARTEPWVRECVCPGSSCRSSWSSGAARSVTDPGDRGPCPDTVAAPGPGAVPAAAPAAAAAAEPDAAAGSPQRAWRSQAPPKEKGPAFDRRATGGWPGTAPVGPGRPTSPIRHFMASRGTRITTSTEHENSRTGGRAVHGIVPIAFEFRWAQYRVGLPREWPPGDVRDSHQAGRRDARRWLNAHENEDHLTPPQGASRNGGATSAERDGRPVHRRTK